MEYKKIKTQIENAVRKSPSDPVPYEDMFSLCRDMEKEDFAKAHKWNQAFRKKISAAIRLSVTDGDMLAAEQFDNLLFRSLLFGAPHWRPGSAGRRDSLSNTDRQFCEDCQRGKILWCVYG